MPVARLIFGCGYIGMRVAERWKSAGDTVYTVTRRPERAAQLAAAGFEPIVADVVQRASLARLPVSHTVLFSVGYDRSSEASIQQVYADGVGNVLAALPDGTGRFVYVSSTGVYGDAGGDWVNETTAPNPQRAGGIASLDAEAAIAADPRGAEAAILRLAGIYGPDRIPYVAALRAGEPIAAPQTGWLNLIHADDAATTVLAAAEAQTAPGVVCVSDGTPPRRADYYAEAARLLNAPPPRFTVPEPGSPRAARAEADKRVRNDKLLKTLGVRLAYPNYRSGLAAILGRL
ncbi:SDR family oxidoreductase [Botrimarina hoheduenensis]|uniref:NAD dependent epimerase/dehydratase family protein n=1 Tax=Botrimarina hoheduenensis TaxID=2528000 RepID=A0A5C5WCZ1_9BACT|nr:SDR family oxidoreductase [Botrimarina hoheduenensis]TWT48357.1 NAD dependent epimerase/dehydratase family protein [Botrimarina hoheduenensis]